MIFAVSGEMCNETNLYMSEFGSQLPIIGRYLRERVEGVRQWWKQRSSQIRLVLHQMVRDGKLRDGMWDGGVHQPGDGGHETTDAKPELGLLLDEGFRLPSRPVFVVWVLFHVQGSGKRGSRYSLIYRMASVNHWYKESCIKKKRN